MNKSTRHVAVYYDQHSSAWVQCAKLIASFGARGWISVYVHDEHSSASVQTGLTNAHAKTRSRKTIAPSIISSSKFGLQNTLVRVSGILTNLRAEVNARESAFRAATHSGAIGRTRPFSALARGHQPKPRAPLMRSRRLEHHVVLVLDCPSVRVMLSKRPSSDLARSRA